MSQWLAVIGIAALAIWGGSKLIRPLRRHFRYRGISERQQSTRRSRA